MSNIISPSLLAADFCSLGDEIARINSAPWLHFDVMDGHFVPNISVGIPVLQSIRKRTDKFLDVHLMIENPEVFVKPFCDAGADLICFHIESTQNPDIVLDEIRKCGKKAAIALKPNTPVSCVLPYLNSLDMVLIMAVEPGYGGQRFIPQVLPKIAEIKNMIKENRLSCLIQVDGGIDEETALLCVKEGANVLVAGSAVFNSENPNETVLALSKSGAKE